MNLKTRIRELAAKAEAVTEFTTIVREISPEQEEAFAAARRAILAQAGQRKGFVSVKRDRYSVDDAAARRSAIARARAEMAKAKQLAAKAEAVTELARGDFAIPALLKIQKAGSVSPLDLTKGNTISALKGNRYPALDGWNGYLSGTQIRKTAADKIRGVRKAQEADELADVPFFSRHPGIKISDAIQRRQLAAKAEAVTEFARGDFAIPALKKILHKYEGMTKSEFNKFSPILKGKFPVSMRKGLVMPDGKIRTPSDLEIMQAVPSIRKEAADAIRHERGYWKKSNEAKLRESLGY